MADIGYVALFLALVASLLSAIAYLIGARREQPAASDTACLGLRAVFALVSIATLVFLYSIFTHNFSLEYVASYSSRDTFWPYLISAWWAGASGSLLFWAWLLSLFAMVLTLRQRQAGRELVPYAAAIVMLTEAFFLILLVSVSNPFLKLPVAPADGTGLNPLLENPGMIFHPPTLLAGYAGLTIPFALAMAALLTGRLGSEWTTAARRWTLLPWLLLGVGNIIGAWWAYVELGWGGYWAWDPVENAGLMPWLVATAFLHSTMAQRRKGMLKVWNMVLIILAFILTVVGTFLTRTGLSELHGFGESGMGPFFLTFIGIALIGSLGLLYYRRHELRDEAEIESLVSRESTLLVNNLLLLGSVFTIFLGTLFPAISETFTGNKIGVGAAFFNLVETPIFMAIILLVGVCAVIGWQRRSGKSLLRSFLWPFVAATVVAAIIFASGVRQGYAVAAFFVCGLVLFIILSEWFRETRARHQARSEGYLMSFTGLVWGNRPRYGGHIVHIAIIVMAIGIAGSSFYGVEKETALKQGESVTINKYTLTYDNMGHAGTPSKFLVTATLSVYNDGKLVGRVTPGKIFKTNKDSDQPVIVTEVAIRSTPAEDLYVILLGWDASGSVAFKVLVNPLVGWVWVGGWLLALGGLIAFWPGRRHLALVREGAHDARAEGDAELAEKEIAVLRSQGGRFCPRCGAAHQAGDRYCGSCGASLKTKGRAEQA